MDLNHQIFETESSGDTLVILHGLFGSARNWTGIARHLSAAYKVVTVDMPNHGNSPWLDDATYLNMAEAVGEFIGANGFSGATVMGHSMGGKAAMVLTLQRPDLIGRLIVADIAPVPYDHGNEEFIDAMEAVDLALVQVRADADGQLARTIDDSGLRGFFLLNLVQEGDTFSWRINLKGLKASLPALHGFPEVPDGSLYGGPVLFLDGEKSNYILPQHEDLIRAYFPHAAIEEIEGADHWIHADQPTAVMTAIRAFMG